MFGFFAAIVGSPHWIILSDLDDLRIAANDDRDAHAVSEGLVM
jgi:hypothetical protein